jgi:acetyl-CoA acetyltransferase
MSVEDHQASPMVSDPLRMFDCCLQTDGAVAVIVTSTERAHDLRQKPAIIAGAVQASMPDPQGPLFSILGRQDITEASAGNAARALWQQTGLSPADIDVAQLYDCFTVTVLMQLEDYGFCGEGESGAFVAEGNIRYGGSIPINTDGGNLSCAYMHGVNHVLEGTRQIRGTSTRQVPDVGACLVTAGTPVPTSALVLTSEPA